MQNTFVIAGTVANKYLINKLMEGSGPLSQNRLYLVNKVGNQGEKYVLKIYGNSQNYTKERLIFQIQEVYGNYLFDSLENHQHQEALTLNCNILQYTEQKSLFDYQEPPVSKQLPISVAKSYLKKILQSLIQVKQRFKILHPRLDLQDIILLQNKSVVVSGWTKKSEIATQKELIANCGELFFKMLFNKGLPFPIFSAKTTNPVSEVTWRKFKKNLREKVIQEPEKKVPVPQDLFFFLELLLVKEREMTLQQLYQHDFMKQVLPLENIREMLDNLEQKITQRQKQKITKDFETKSKREEIKNRSFEEFDGSRCTIEDEQEESFRKEYEQIKEELGIAEEKSEVSQKIVEQSSVEIKQNEQLLPFKYTKSQPEKNYFEEPIKEPKNVKKKSGISISLSNDGKPKQINKKLIFMLAWVKDYFAKMKKTSLVFPERYVLLDEISLQILKATNELFVFKLQLKFFDYSNCDIDFSEKEEEWPDPSYQSILLEVVVYPKQQDRIKIRTQESNCGDYYNRKLEKLIEAEIESSLRSKVGFC